MIQNNDVAPPQPAERPDTVVVTDRLISLGYLPGFKSYKGINVHKRHLRRYATYPEAYQHGRLVMRSYPSNDKILCQALKVCNKIPSGVYNGFMSLNSIPLPSVVIYDAVLTSQNFTFVPPDHNNVSVSYNLIYDLDNPIPYYVSNRR